VTSIWANRTLSIASLLVALAIMSFSHSHPTAAQSPLDEANALNTKVIELYRASKAGEAIPLAKRALALREKALPAGHPQIATSLSNLARLYHTQGRLGEAEPLYKRALGMREKALRAGHPQIALSLNNLAGLYEAQGRLSEAEPLYERALALLEKALRAGHPDIATSLNNLAALYHTQGRLGEAEPLYKRALGMREKALPAGHPDIATSLNNLAFLYRAQGRLGEAEPLYKRALALFEKALPAGHPKIATSLNNLALLYDTQGRLGDAEPLYKRALGMREKALPAGHPKIASSLNNLAALYRAQGRLGEAEPLYKRALALFEKALPAGHPQIALSLNNLALLYQVQGRLGEAELLYKRALALFEKALPAGHPQIASSLNNLAGLYFVQRDWQRTTDYLRQGTSIIAQRTRRGTSIIGGGLTGKTKSEGFRNSLVFSVLVKTSYRLARQQSGSNQTLAREMFKTSQWASGSEAAAALARMSARQASSGGALAGPIRQRQDLVAEWHRRDQLSTGFVSQPAAKRNRKAEEVNRARLSDIDGLIAEIDKRLAKEFPDYAALVNPEPLSVEDVQGQLGADEALVLILSTPKWKSMPEETFIWVVTKTESRWVRSAAGTEALKREVAALRCGLDFDGSWKGTRCFDLLNVVYTEADRDEEKPLPFQFDRAHKLYRSLFGQVEDLILDKHLLIVPSGALNALPFQVLVTQAPEAAIPADLTGYAKIKWLGQRNAITILPSVSSLKALRAHAKTSRASQAFIGFGNPLLTGADGTDKRAWARQTCPAPSVAARMRTAALSLSQKIASFFRGGLANVDDVRRQSPLPETTDELCAVARASGIDAPDNVVFLGERATETQVKALSSNGALSRARIVHFATHGLIAGETASFANNLAEPSLLLTPPVTASEKDDGLLTASEITTLKLDADWVILSACNTASGDTVGGDAFSGLARAFFYAGARALLVSHWYVDSQATVALVTGAFKELKRDPRIGRAEAMRRAMSSLIASGGRNAHPANWAPFVVVGEGAGGR
jgi:CHAT domain-containing protein/tetratricopeptide (TPR) repeat protein